MIYHTLFERQPWWKLLQDSIQNCLAFTFQLFISRKKFYSKQPINHNKEGLLRIAKQMDMGQFFTVSSTVDAGLSFIKTDQLGSWIKFQVGKTLLPTTLFQQLLNFVTCGMDQSLWFCDIYIYTYISTTWFTKFPHGNTVHLKWNTWIIMTPNLLSLVAPAVATWALFY